MIDVEFSLALYNRSGKYFIGRDIIEDNRDIIRNIYFWRISSSTVPSGLAARVLGRLQHWEHAGRVARTYFTALAARPSVPILHLDPFSVVHSKLESKDIVLCHDLGPLTHPSLFKPYVYSLYRAAFEKINEAKPKLVFVSAASRDAYCQLYSQYDDMHVIYPPIRSEIAQAPSHPVEGIGSKFFLTVGAVGARKNQVSSIKAFDASGLASEGWQYVICGSREPGWEDASVAAANTKGVVLLNYVSDEELAWLYGNASGFILVSLLEGFGVPVAEAIARGQVPLVSESSVLQEVAGPGALTANPLNLSDITAKIVYLAQLSELERDRRKQLLLPAIRRFEREAFRKSWATLLAS